ncbi:hypothetical protein O181_111701 [Austropuccinia psidii MF-1]|uniref:Uncharacterized protein n=1 Tax=Austropuccinia psidii MF-1 TaxID=1389203 RepID=A0A9Q3PSX0_9BASI|nr:hypothetical protein [Austropuccinia psidii MF-1]
MEAFTSVELVQKKGFQPKQLVNSVSPVCGKNGFHFNRKQNPVSELYKPYVEAIFSKPKHSISPMDLLRVTSGASIKFTQNLFNKFKNKRMQEELKEDSPVENQNQNNEQITSDLSYNNIIQEETHQKDNPSINPSLKEHTLHMTNSNPIENESSSQEEQNIKTEYQSCSKVNYLSIQEDKIEGKDEHKELNTNNEDVAQYEEFNSPIYVRVGWEEYPVMAIMNPSLEDNILPLKVGSSIGMKPKKKNQTKNKILMKNKFCHDFSVIKSIHKSSLEFEESTNSQDKELRESRSGIEEHKGHNLEKEDKGYGNLDLEEYDRLLKRQYNMGYYYDQQRKEESASRVELDYGSGSIKEFNGINAPMEGKDSKWTEIKSNKDE